MIPRTVPSYGDWSLAVIYTLVFAMLAFLFYRPKTRRDWQAFGAFAAFLAALFAENVGFPLTIYLLSGWGGPKFLHIESVSHEVGHVLDMMFDWRANPPFGIFQIAGTVLILGGFVLLASAWSALHKAHQRRELARTGVYARIRHPEYASIRTDHDRLSAAVADADHAGDVPIVGLFLRTACAPRRTRSIGALWRVLPTLPS